MNYVDNPTDTELCCDNSKILVYLLFLFSRVLIKLTLMLADYPFHFYTLISGRHTSPYEWTLENLFH